MLQEQQKTNTLPLALEEEEDESAGYECVRECVCEYVSSIKDA